MNYRLNEFYMQVLREWTNSVDTDSKEELTNLVKSKLKNNPGLSQDLKQLVHTHVKVQQKPSPEADNRGRKLSSEEEVLADSQQSCDQKHFNMSGTPQVKVVYIDRSKKEEMEAPEQEDLGDLSCSSGDVIELIEDQIRLNIFGTMTTPRKNKLNMLQFGLQNVLIKTARETFFRSLTVKMNVELYSNKKLESLLIKKS